MLEVRLLEEAKYMKKYAVDENEVVEVNGNKAQDESTAYILESSKEN